MLSLDRDSVCLRNLVDPLDRLMASTVKHALNSDLKAKVILRMRKFDSLVWRDSAASDADAGFRVPMLAFTIVQIFQHSEHMAFRLYQCASTSAILRLVAMSMTWSNATTKRRARVRPLAIPHPDRTQSRSCCFGKLYRERIAPA
jgi:hypothetical protein